MTKTEYREYLSSKDWQERRKEFLSWNEQCARCEIPRWLAEVAYDQDLNVHHLSYENLGEEKDDDLEALCRRCHEIEKFGRSDLREPKTATCEQCDCKHWNPYDSLCDVCRHSGLFLANCSLCGGNVWTLPGRSHPFFCKICDGISRADPRTIWKIANRPFSKEHVVGDPILFALMARLGVDKILTSMCQFEAGAVGYDARQLQKDKEEEEIPF